MSLMFTSFLSHKAKMEVEPSADIKGSRLILQMFPLLRYIILFHVSDGYDAALSLDSDVVSNHVNLIQ